MIVDTSAIMAIIDDEAEAADVIARLESGDPVRMSAATRVELTAVLQRYGSPEVHRFAQRLLDGWGIEIVPFDAEQGAIAQQAYRDYGRGSGHPARLNLGDCFSYALATVAGEPLLYVGDDFSRTDIPPAR